jgi:hypothetical protein
LASDVRKGHRLKAFENRVLRRIFGLKRDEMVGSWRNLLNEELHGLHSSPSIIKNDAVKDGRMGRACSTNGKTTNACGLLLGKPEVKCKLIA